MRLFILLLCATLISAEDSAAVAEFKKAMTGQEFAAKRTAIQALASKDAGDDDTILPLLVSAVGDRQGSDPAIKALRARTGLVPPESKRAASAYPGYPSADTQDAWGVWLQARTKDLAIQKKLEPPKAAAAAPVATTEAPAAAPVDVPPPIPTDDLGKIDRIVYKSGRTLTAYVRSKRLDGDGNLVSVRVVHRNGSGEEVIDAQVIARIEDDIE